jgi:tetratricopeptide (TPR) repeat protein/CHAT domain-containing protein
MRFSCLAVAMIAVCGLTSLKCAASVGCDRNELTDLEQHASRLYEGGEYAAALPVSEKAAECSKKLYGLIHPEYAWALEKLGQIYSILGQTSLAESQWGSATEILERSFGDRHPYLVDSLDQLAWAAISQGRQSEGEKILRRSLAIREEVFGVRQIMVAIGLDNLALAIGWQDRKSEAEAMIKRGLAIRERAYGHDDPVVAKSLDNLGMLREWQGRLEDAGSLFQQALGIRERALGPAHPEVGSSLANLAGLYGFYLDQYEMAESLYRRQLASLERELGPEHPSVAGVLSVLTLVQAKQKRATNNILPIRRRILKIHEKAYGPTHDFAAHASYALAEAYQANGNMDDAARFYDRSLGIWEKNHGRDYVLVAATLERLATVYQSAARYAQAERAIRRALDIRQTDSGHDSPLVAGDLNTLADILNAQGNYLEAEKQLLHALEIGRRDLKQNHITIISSLTLLAVSQIGRSNLEEASSNLEKALEICETFLAQNHPRTGLARATLKLLDLVRKGGRIPDELSSLASRFSERLDHMSNDDDIYSIMAIELHALASDFQGKFDETEKLYKQALRHYEKKQGSAHPNVAKILSSLANMYRYVGRYDEAEAFIKKAWVIRNQSFGSENAATASSISDLGLLYWQQGRLNDAASLLEHALVVQKDALEAPHTLAHTMSSLAAVYVDLGRFDRAEPLYRNALAILESALGAENHFLADSLGSLAELLRLQRRYPQAEPLYKRALAIALGTFGEGNIYVARYFNDLALFYDDWGKPEKAAPLWPRALSIRKKILGVDHPYTALTLNNVGWHYSLLKDWAKALEYYEQSTSAVLSVRDRYAGIAENAVDPRNVGVPYGKRYQLLNHIDAADMVAKIEPGRASELGKRMFRVAQSAQLGAAGLALSQMAVRFGAANGELAGKVRELQDLVRQHRYFDDQLIRALSKPLDQRDASDAASEARLRQGLTTAESRLAEIRRTLVAEFPRFSELAFPSALSIEEVRELLRPQEALLFVIVTRQRTVVWLVTKSESRWVRFNLSMRGLAQKVQILRCGLDDSEWDGIERPARCAKLLGVARRPDDSEPLPFSFATANELYKALLAPFKKNIKDKRLLIVPSGPLTSLPFHVLVTEEPNVSTGLKYEDYRDVAWLARRQTIAVLPSVASLKSLRKFAKASPGLQAYVGYGDPALTGNHACHSMRQVKNTCSEAGPSIRGASAPRHRQRRAHRSAGLDRVFRKGGSQEAVLAEVRALCPLPDTRQEIRCVAKSLGVPESEIHVGGTATENGIKTLSENGRLSAYKVIHFATHGLLAGDVTRLAKRQGEPALVLTPPANPKDNDDDGLLMASEVANLKLNADWVILSACNTAAGETLGAEALSGLARAFFYAGARTLLVSHWPVYSDAAVRLITGTFQALKMQPEIGRAEALRRAMVGLIDDLTLEDNAHPTVWAPFVVAGEGGRLH